MDVDLHGPDIPHMLGVENAILEQSTNGILPLKVRDNLEVMSIEFMLPSKDRQLSGEDQRKPVP